MHHVALRVDDIDAALAHLKSRGIRLIDEQRAARRRRRAGRLHSSVGGARRARRAEAAGAEGGAVQDGRPAHARRPRADHAVGRLLRASMAARCSAWCRERCGRSACRRTMRTGFRSSMRPLIVRSGDAHDDHRRRLRRQDGREERADLQARSPLSSRSLARRGRPHRRGHRHRRSPATCISITSAASRRSAKTARIVPRFPKARYIAHRARVGRRHASARAQSRQLSAGELRAAEGCRRADAGGRWRGDHARCALPALGRPHARITRW